MLILQIVITKTHLCINDFIIDRVKIIHYNLFCANKFDKYYANTQNPPLPNKRNHMY